MKWFLYTNKGYVGVYELDDNSTQSIIAAYCEIVKLWENVWRLDNTDLTIRDSDDKQIITLY